jgi:hypothetical protein
MGTFVSGRLSDRHAVLIDSEASFVVLKPG